ncbi:hypothetical protein SLUN_00255 [Streptomyces lunaelactis]|uniref:LysM domain-containing protein n=1 Tax=Streptomyces lunaelactis TaxID=1535768 RepID=A0A2R4SVP3_9ACTN|nr:hypothetical protein SLUN_00255 [Streptomyces lunaelactis]
MLVALLTGLPWLLWEAIWAAAPAGMDDLTHLFTRQDTSGAFILALAAVGWISWGSFALALLLEIPAQLRGRTAPRLPGFRLSQRVAATLVGGLLVLLPTGTAMASPAQASPTLAAEQLPGHGGPTAAATARADGGGGQQQPEAAESGAGQRVYTVRDVRPAESLWQIAENELGSGELYTRIADLNDGRTMADGSVFHADASIKPGWTLLLPADHTSHAAAKPPPAPTFQLLGSQQESDDSYTVEPGDYLSKIAQEQLGDGDRWPELYDANRDQVQDPDLIYPGQQLDLPAQRSPVPGESTDPAEPPQHNSPPADDDAPQGNGDGAEPESDGAPETAVPSHEAPADRGDHQVPPVGPTSPGGVASKTPSATPAPTSQAPTTPAASSPAIAAPDSVTEEGQSGIGVREVAGVGMLLAAGLLATLSLKRILQRRRRKPGETIAMPEETGQLEQVLAATQEPGSIHLLDTALRTLAHHAQHEGEHLPSIRGARVTARTVELLPDDTELEPPPPFTRGTDAWWRLNPDTPLLDSDAAAAPYPGLTTIGTDPDGGHLLLNLPHTGTLLLDGTPSEVLATTRAIALEAATCAWSDHADILTVGLGNDIAALLPQGRIRPVPHLRAALSDLGELLLESHQVADEEEPVCPLPWVLICAAEATESDAWELADAISKARHLPVALVLPASVAGGCFPDAERLAAATDTLQRCETLDSDLAIQYVTEADYESFVQTLATTEDPASPAEGPWQSVPDAHLDTSTAGASAGGPGAAGRAAPFPALAAAAGTPTSFRIVSPTTPNTGTGEPDAVESESTRNPTQSSAVEDDDPIDLHTPEISILGPILVSGIKASGHGNRLATLAALVYFKPGRSAEVLCEAMEPRKPWSKMTLQARMSELRNRLGVDTDGEPYLPRERRDGYRLSPKVRCDWSRFQSLAERGLARGPGAGMGDLESALRLVRGRPFGGADHDWASPLVQEMLARIIDVAHTLATWHRTGPDPDLDAARRAITVGLDIDDSAEILYQAWMLIDDQVGNRAGVLKAIETLQAVNRRLDVSMEPATERVIDNIFSKPAQLQRL